MNSLTANKTKIERVARTFRSITADSEGNLPTRIEILKVGMWDTPYHGMFMITPDDCAEMVENFDAGVAMPGGPVSEGGVGLPIDFGHDSDELAAGWIKGLDFDGMTLYADPVEWTAAGKEALLGGNYKCFSPEFYPASRGGWEDPEAYGEYVPNVLVGGGLTNIPLFKGLKPIMASTKSGETDKKIKNVIYISASEKENKMPTLEEVRAKSAEALTEEDKSFLVEHKNELTAEDRTKFGFEVQQVKAEDPADPADPAEDPAEDPAADPAAKEAEAVAASVKSGESVVIKASEFNSMKASIAKFEKQEAESKVKAHVARGAIKADSLGKWADKLLADPEAEELLKSIPDNKLLADEMGAANANEEIDERERTVKLAKAKVDAAAAKGETLKIEVAMKQAQAEIKASQEK